MTRREFWLHKPSGRVWAVELNTDGDVVTTAGPLDPKDADPAALDHMPFDGRYVGWISHYRAEFTRLERVRPAAPDSPEPPGPVRPPRD